MTLLDIAEALGWALLHSLWEGAIVAGAFAVLLGSTRSPRIRYVAGCVALLAMLGGFALTLIYFLPETSGGRRVVFEPGFGPRGELPGANASGGGFGEIAAFIPWLAPVWLVGVCLFYMRYMLAWLSSYRLRRRGVCRVADVWQVAIARLAMELRISRPIVLLESLLADAPVVIGHFRPMVLAPLGFLAGLPPDQVEAILLHELAHIRRSDYLVNTCQRLMEGLLFYHPAVWWISGVVRVEREHCCDDMVVELRGDAHSYAVALAALEQNRVEQTWQTCDTAVAATGGNLMKRIKRLLYPNAPSGIWTPALAAVVLIASAATVLSAWQESPKRSTAAEKKENQITNPWEKWLNEDVVYIISKEEKAAFRRLKTDEERQHFAEQFWAHREARGGTGKEEHHRRIQFANDHFAENKAGWRTDRGHTYILYGPPDEIDSHPSAGRYERPAAEGGGGGNTYPFEDWRYHEGGGKNRDVEFVDRMGSAEFRIATDPKEKYRKP